MTQDTKYAPIEMTYQSRGLTARAVQDAAPAFSYLNLFNMLERQENSFSSRYGTQIINRDPAGTGTENYYFTAPVNSLARMTYLGQSYRYAGTSNGQLWRRTGDTQGAYTQIDSFLSGQPFQTVVTNAFQSSQPYLFIYDAATSIKDNGVLAAPQLTGIDPPVYTANVAPYSPLLTLIDNFNSSNSYTTSGFSSAWTYTPVSTLIAASGQIVTDFTEFLGVQPSGAGVYGIAGGTVIASATVPNTVSNSGTYSGFPSVAVTPFEYVTLSVAVGGLVFSGVSHFSGGSGAFTLSYSIDSGATFTPFYSASGSTGEAWDSGVSIQIPGIVNIDTLQIKIDTSATADSRNTSNTTNVSGIGGGNITATIAAANVFGAVANGMLCVFAPESSVTLQISSVLSSGLTAGIYQTLTVTTQTAHGLTAGEEISIYGCSNDLVDGFYKVITAPTATTFTVAYVSPVLTGAVGGVVYGGASSPETCVLTNEYSAPYPAQMSAWGFYQQVPSATTNFPIGSWQGTVDTNTTATVGVTTPINLNINDQATDDDLIVLTIAIGDPSDISNISLQFDINGSNYTANYYYKDISPAYYQQNVQAAESAYDATQSQILADTLGLITGQAPNSTAAQLQPANISTGQNAWQTIYMRRGDFVAVGNAGESGSDWAAVTGWQLVITTNTSGPSTIAVNGLYFQWGYGPSSFGGVGYDYRYTYWNSATGTESNGSPIQEFLSTGGYLPSLTAPFFLRQAVQVTGQYSTDPQVTHLRIYRRGGLYAQNWYQIDQVPNVAGAGQFFYKDVIPDAILAQANILVLDNDPPVTSSLQNPISTTIQIATTSPGNTIYSSFAPQTVTVVDNTAVFVPGQIVALGNASTLEQVRVITGGTGSFTAIVRLPHNVGEPVGVFSFPRQPCNLCALAYNQVWLAGDPNNPNYLYFSKKNLPENFGPQNYIPVGSSGDTIMIVVNWRGTLFVATDKSWYSIVGGASPYPQPTGAAHGAVSSTGWTQSETAVWFRAADGYREFTGAVGAYATLPVEFIFRPNPFPPYTPVPLVNPTQAVFDVMAFYNNSVYCAYTATDDARYRLNYDTNYKRFRNDDVAATAMLWEQDTNTFLVAKRIGSTGSSFAIVQDQVGDYDDGGWVAGTLVQTPINLILQTPYGDQGKPHFPKQYNVLETDVDTQGQVMNTELFFNTETPLSIVLDTATTTGREKVQLKINNGDGQQAYSMSIQHTMAVTVAPTFYQENIYAAVLAAYRSSFDTYWIKMGTDESKLVKQAYFDYTSDAPIIINLYADGDTTPYYTFTLPTNAERAKVPMRARFPAIKLRQFRCVGTCTGDYQFWDNPTLHWKAIKVGTGYANYDFTV